MDVDVVEEIEIISRLRKLVEEDAETVTQYLVPTRTSAMKFVLVPTGKRIHT